MDGEKCGEKTYGDDMNSAYNLKDVLRYLMMVVGVCVLMMPTKGAGFLVLVVFTLLALFRTESTQLVWGLLLANAIRYERIFRTQGFCLRH